ncbi:MAG: DMT family transporter [Burkholderiaceae bacterium]
MPSTALLSDQKKAALFALGAATLLPIVDAMVKVLVQDHPVVMVAWVRMGLIALFLGLVATARSGPAVLLPRSPGLQILRGLCAVLGTAMIFVGFRVMPLADCTAIVFIAPVLSNLLSIFWLNERGDRRSWVLAVLSFIGVLIIAKPGTSLFAPEAVWPLLGALGLAGFLTLTRAVSGRDCAQTTAFFGPFVAFIVFSLVLPFTWIAPTTPGDVGLFVAIGVLASIATTLQTLAFRYGSTHQVAPFSYASVIVAILLGWGVFHTLPDGWSLLGMAVIVCCGLAMLRPATRSGRTNGGSAAVPLAVQLEPLRPR